MKNDGRIGSIFIVIFVCLGSYILHAVYASLRCPSPEIASERPISGTDWLVQMRVQGCGFVTYMTDIRVIKRDGSIIIVLVTGDDIDEIYIDTSRDHTLVLAIPNKLSNLKFHHETVPGVEVSLRFRTVTDDKIR